MIEIIKTGTKTKETCKVCGCLFSYEAEDVKFEKPRSLDSREGRKYIDCPQCKSRIYFMITR